MVLLTRVNARIADAAGFCAVTSRLTHRNRHKKQNRARVIIVDKLKPCPFCGQDVTIVNEFRVFAVCHLAAGMVYCPGQTSAWFDTREMAIAAWNRRDVAAARATVDEAADIARERAEADTFGEGE